MLSNQKFFYSVDLHVIRCFSRRFPGKKLEREKVRKRKREKVVNSLRK